MNESGMSYALPGERIDDLQFKNLKIIQNPKAFCFGMDAILLSDFSEIRPGERVVDLGSGTGILSLLLAARSKRTHFDAVELQADMADMAARTVLMNDMADKIKIHCLDLRQISKDKLLCASGYDTVVCNPPYGKQGDILCRDERHRLARQDGCTIEDIASAVFYLLRNSGRFYVIFPAVRLLELSETLKSHRLEPKLIRMIQPNADKAPNLVLVGAYKNARPGLQFMKPLIVYDANGEYTGEVNRIYHKGGNDI